MRLFFVLLIILNSMSSFAVAEISISERSKINESIFKQIAKDVSQQTNLSTYLSSLKGKIDEKLRKFLIAKTATFPNTPLPQVVAAQDGFSFVTKNGTSIPFKVISTENGKFSLNNQTFTIEPGDAPDKLWDKVVDCLPSEVSSNYFDFILPNAHAVAPLAYVIGALAVTTVGASSAAVAIFACNKIRFTYVDCTSADTRIFELETMSIATRIPAKPQENLKEKIDEMVTVRDSLSSKYLAVSCNDPKRRLSNCINELVQHAEKAFHGFRYSLTSPGQDKTQSGSAGSAN